MNNYKTLVKRMMETLDMVNVPVGIKVTDDLSMIKDSYYQPFKQEGKHYAMCQAITMVKRKHITVALTKQDHWCWKPLIGYGLVDMKPGTKEYDIGIRNNGVKDMCLSANNFDELPKLERNDNNVILIAPLDDCDFEPDVILLYCNNNTQLRWIIGALKYRSGKRVYTEFDYIDSCIWSTLPTIMDKKVWVTLPDPGEELRADCGVNEIIASIPPELFEQLVEDLEMKISSQKRRLNNEDGSLKMECSMVPDFPRPNFYNVLFDIWGLQSDGKVAWSEKERE